MLLETLLCKYVMYIELLDAPIPAKEIRGGLRTGTAKETSRKFKENATDIKARKKNSSANFDGKLNLNASSNMLF